MSARRRATGARRVAGWLGDDAARMIRDWRPPERAEPDEGPGRRPARRRAPEPTWGRTDAAGVARRLLQRRALFPLLEAMGRPEVRGLHHVLSVRPPLVFAPNHVSHADAPLVLKALPERVRERTLVPAAADYFFDRRWLSVLVTLAMNAVPFDRRHDIADSVRRCERLLRHGHSIVLFPEGTRSPTGRLRGFKAGVAHLAVGTGAPVIPVFVQGTHALLPRGAALPRPSAVAVHFGEPLHALPDETARQFNERLERAVASLGAGIRAHAHRDRTPRRPGWRETWRTQRGEVVPLDGAVAAPPAGAGAPAGGWRERWRSTTPR